MWRSIRPRTCAASCHNAGRSRNLLRWSSIALLLASSWLASPALAHDAVTTKLTWTQEISRLVYRHCAACHREGGRAFSLTTYEDARPWAKAIRDEVLGRRMPPWGAVKGIGQFHDDPSLSLPEIDMFVTWVEGGAPEGDPMLLPSRVPSAAGPDPVVASRKNLEVSGELTLSASVTVLGLRPVGLQDHGSLEAWVVRPGGDVERLIWLKDYAAASTRDYRLRAPVRLPRGARVRVAGTAGVRLILLAD